MIRNRKREEFSVTLSKVQHFFHGNWRKLPWVRNTLIGMTPLFVIYLCQLITLQSSAEALAWIDSHTEAVFLTYGLLFFIEVTIIALWGRFFPGALVITLPTVLFAVANHLKVTVNGAPILASDLAMVGEVRQIAGFLRPGIELGSATWQALLMAAGLLALAFLYSRRDGYIPWGRRILAFALSLSLLCNVTLLPPAVALLGGLEHESQGSRNERLGLLAGIYSALRDSAMEKPDAYSENNMNRIRLELEQLQEIQVGDGVKPNIVLLASESFFDVTQLPRIDFWEDPIPNYRALVNSFAGGKFLSSAYAGGTGNVEMELFTGIPSAFPGASESLTSLSDQLAYHRMPSLVKTLGGQGYDSVMVHAYNNSLYQRAITMPAIGFDETIYSADFTVELQRQGGYLSDDTLANQMIARFEGKGEAPLFLYGLSMENHQPYHSGKFDGPSGVEYTCDTLVGKDAGALDALIQGIHHADEALGKLVNYFQDCGEPVLLVFFGDHLPGLYLDGNDTIYSKLGYSSSPDTEDWDSNELRRMHQTDFLVWNNFDAELEVPSEVSVTHMVQRFWTGRGCGNRFGLPG